MKPHLEWPVLDRATPQEVREIAGLLLDYVLRIRMAAEFPTIHVKSPNAAVRMLYNLSNEAWETANSWPKEPNPMKSNNSSRPYKDRFFLKCAICGRFIGPNNKLTDIAVTSYLDFEPADPEWAHVECARN